MTINRLVIILALSLASIAVRAETIAIATPTSQTSIRDITHANPRNASKLESRLYLISVAALSAGTASDIASSIKFTKAGQTESNGFLSSGSGGYGSKGTLIEAGAVGASLLVQHLLIKRHPGLKPAFTISNFGFAAFQAWNVHHNIAY